jgi:DHA1 family bicyclomycin/chloramphenicol resistance-like MFS transporter
LECIPDLKGTCASFIMSSRLLTSSAAVALTGLWFDGSMRPVALINVTVMLLALGLYCYRQKVLENKQLPA